MRPFRLAELPRAQPAARLGKLPLQQFGLAHTGGNRWPGHARIQRAAQFYLGRDPVIALKRGQTLAKGLRADSLGQGGGQGHNKTKRGKHRAPVPSDRSFRPADHIV